MKTDDASNRPAGSTLLGFLAAFFGGCVGFAAVWVFAKGLRTKQGAVFGLIAWTAAVCVIWLTLFAISSLTA